MATKVDVSPKLYEAATESLVSESSATSTFEKMIGVAFTHSTADTFQQEVKATEKQIKTEFEVTSMPGPWRSAKSVITSSMALGIGLCDSNGTFYGKTYLQNKIKELKIKTGKEDVTEAEYVNKICKMLATIPSDMDAKHIYSEVHKFLMGV